MARDCDKEMSPLPRILRERDVLVVDRLLEGLRRSIFVSLNAVVHGNWQEVSVLSWAKRVLESQSLSIYIYIYIYFDFASTRCIVSACVFRVRR